jgi:hypothetical protein
MFPICEQDKPVNGPWSNPTEENITIYPIFVLSCP